MMNRERNTEATPDSLMASFKGRKLKPILLFTLVAHVVVIGGSSVPYFIRKAMENSKLSEAERIELAVEETTAALRKIATKYDASAKDITAQFSGGSRAAKTPGTDAVTTPDAALAGNASGSAGERERSAYETNLEVKVEGPTVPTFEDEEDIF